MIFSQETEDAEMSNFIISSKAFANKSNIPVDYSCEGADQSPPLSWNNAPANTKGYALTCVDPDRTRPEDRTTPRGDPHPPPRQHGRGPRQDRDRP